MTHNHSHTDSHHLHHDHSIKGSTRRALAWAFGINFCFLIVEFIGGIISNSLALLADAGHMLSDVAALGFALVIVYIAEKPPSRNRTYGYGRAEVLSGMLNALALWFVVGIIFFEAFRRLKNPVDIDAPLMLGVSIAGLFANAISAFILAAHQKHDLNIKGAFLHLIGDTLGSVGAIAAAVLIWWRGWLIADPIASFIIGLIILWTSWGLIKETLNILLEGTPPGLDIDKVRTQLLEIDGVSGIHDLHAWLVSSREPMLTAHLEVDVTTDKESVLDKAKSILKAGFAIDHCTVQVECTECEDMHA